MVVPVCPLATIRCEPRQARKGAAAMADSGAGVWRAGAASPNPQSSEVGLKLPPLQEGSAIVQFTTKAIFLLGIGLSEC